MNNCNKFTSVTLQLKIKFQNLKVWKYNLTNSEELIQAQCQFWTKQPISYLYVKAFNRLKHSLDFPPQFRMSVVVGDNGRPRPRHLRQEAVKFKARLDYRARHCLKIQTELRKGLAQSLPPRAQVSAVVKGGKEAGV